MAKSIHPAGDTHDSKELWNRNVELTIDAIGDIVVHNLDVSILLIFIQLDEVSQIMGRLHHLCNKGKREEAAKELLAAIKRSPDPGKWRMFINALKEVSGEDSIILHYLFQSESTDPWLDSAEHRKVIDLFREPIHEYVNIEALMPRMIQDDLISKHHERQIMAKLRNGQTAYAQVELIAAMQSHQINWYRKFVTILYKDEHTRCLAESIDPDFCKEKLEEVLKCKEAEESRQKQERQDNIPPGDFMGNDDAGSTSADSSRNGAENDRSDLNHGQIMGTPDPHQGEVSCGCRCCAQLRMEVTSLNSAVLQFGSELKEIKQILVDLVQKVDN